MGLLWRFREGLGAASLEDKGEGEGEGNEGIV
jgi:hypothetical protein